MHQRRLVNGQSKLRISNPQFAGYEFARLYLIGGKGG